MALFQSAVNKWEKWNRERFGDDRAKWRPPLKILIVCDRLLTGFDAPISTPEPATKILPFCLV
jgi:type I restriction enzyme R subunit